MDNGGDATARPFWQSLRNHGGALALVEANSDRHLTYAHLADEVEKRAQSFNPGRKLLVLLPLNSRMDDILWYLAALASGVAVIPYHDSQPVDQLARLIELFRPGYIMGKVASSLPNTADYSRTLWGEGQASVILKRMSDCAIVHPEVALLLPTSGTTGLQKLVKLSKGNLSVNAVQIQRALKLRQDDIAVTSLPLVYIYGLSVLHSHLATGAAVAIESRSVMDKAFWESLAKYCVTTLAGVPSTYRLLETIGADSFDLPQLKTLTISGDRYSTQTFQWLLAGFGKRGIDIFSMYGQTEAGGRISALPPHEFRDHPFCVGYPVQGGSVTIAADGMVVYDGPNVMHGYATTADDLAHEDELNGRLVTGDLGRMDADGRLYLGGRASRIAKLFGIRFSLDELEAAIRTDEPVCVVTEPGDDFVTVLTTRDDDRLRARALAASKLFKLPRSTIRIREVPRIEQTASGKYCRPG